jgi:hypothetical protein
LFCYGNNFTWTTNARMLTHSGTNPKIKWDMCLCILNIIQKYAVGTTILKIDIKYTFLVRFHIFSRNDRLFRLLTDFVCLYNYEFWLSLCKIVRSSVILLLPLFHWLVWRHRTCNMELFYQNSSWGKGLIKSRNNESYTFHL